MQRITVDVESGRRMGESNSQAKLKNEQVVEIRRMRKAGATLIALAQQFGVSRSCIWYAVKGGGWKLDRSVSACALNSEDSEKVVALKKKGLGGERIARELGVNISSAKRLLRELDTTRETCLRGHPLVAENIYMDPKGARTCRTCNRAAALAYYRRKQTTAKKAKD